MIDTLICEYKLPLPEFSEEEKNDLKVVEWNKMSFFSKSLEGEMDKYTISEDGQIYKHLTRNLIRKKIPQKEGELELEEEDMESYPPSDLVMEEVDDGILRLDYTGEIIFYSIIYKEDNFITTQDGEFDYFISFKVLFWKGLLKEISLEEYKKIENKTRKEAQNRMMSTFNEVDKREEKRKSWWYPCFSIFREVTIFFLNFLKNILVWIFTKLIKITIKLRKF